MHFSFFFCFIVICCFLLVFWFCIVQNVDLSPYAEPFKLPIAPLREWIVDTGAEDTDNVVYVKDFFNNGREWIREYITDVTVTGVNWSVLSKYLNKYFDREELHDMWLQFVDSKINSIEADRTIDLLEMLYQNAIDRRVCVTLFLFCFCNLC